MIRVVSDIAVSNLTRAGTGRISELNFGRSWRTRFWITQHTPDGINDIINADSCCEKAVQFSASFVITVCQFFIKFVG